MIIEDITKISEITRFDLNIDQNIHKFITFSVKEIYLNQDNYTLFSVTSDNLYDIQDHLYLKGLIYYKVIAVWFSVRKQVFHTLIRIENYN